MDSDNSASAAIVADCETAAAAVTHVAPHAIASHQAPQLGNEQQDHQYSHSERAKLRPFRVEFRRQFVNTAPLAFTDLVIGAAVLFTSASLTGLIATPALHGLRLAVVLPSLVVSLWLAGTYPGIGIDPVTELRRLWIGTTGLMTALLAAFVAQSPSIPAASGFAVLSWALLLLLLPLGRTAIRSWLTQAHWWGEPALVLGAGAAGRRVYDALVKETSRGIRPLGIVDTADEMWRESDPNAQANHDSRNLRIGLAEELPALAERLRINWVVIAHSDDPNHPTRHDWLSYASGIPHVIIESPDPATSVWSDSRELGGCHALYRPDQIAQRWTTSVKRTMDIALVLAFAPIVAPLVAVLALLVRFRSPDGPIFYGQRRIGRGGKTFTAWKFRTMVPNAEALLSESLASNPALREEWLRVQKLRNDPRVIAGVGTFLRKSSLDELPQLWNVLCGEMSLVGPRPLPLSEFNVYGADNVYGHYALVRPGITGVWQVSGRNDLDYEAKPALDEYYVRNWSPWLDIYILGRTIRTVLLREGAY